jgi:shikimate dehydrogenase
LSSSALDSPALDSPALDSPELGSTSSPVGTTRVCAVIGDPVTHSVSPILHNAAFRATGLDWVYVAFSVEFDSGPVVVDAMRTLGLMGLSVTMPHKQAIARYADEASVDVVALGAGNTLRWVGDAIRAETTDGAGCVAALQEVGVDATGKRVMVIGAGGAGRAVIQAMAREGVREVVIVNRSPERATAALSVSAGIGRVGSIDEADSCDIIINATPIGMGYRENNGDVSEPNAVAVDPSRLGPGQVVNDLVYFPLVTPLMAAAEVRGAHVIGGLGMLLHQAALQFTWWTGIAAPFDAMRSALNTELSRRSA